MRILNANDWRQYDKNVSFAVNKRETVDIEVSGIGAVISLVNSNGEAIPVASGDAINFRALLVGWEEIHITANAVFGVCYLSKRRQESEPMDDAPPPRPEPPTNMLARIRHKVRQEMGTLREAFAERDIDYPGHELPDDFPDIFEEEEYQLVTENKKQATNDTNQTPPLNPPSGGGNPPDDNGGASG